MKQRQLEEQDRLISESLNFRPAADKLLNGTVTDGLNGVSDSHITYEVPYCASEARLEYADHPILPDYRSGIQLSRATTDVTPSKSLSFLPSFSSDRLESREIANSAVDLHNVAGVGMVAQSGKILTDSHIREYQDELLKRQTDQQHSLVNARRRLQMRAEQLLHSGFSLLSESRNDEAEIISHSHSLTQIPHSPGVHDTESYSTSPVAGNGVLHVESGEMLEPPIDVTKPYTLERYQQKPLSEDVESFDCAAAVASPIDDDRQFVTPELREDGRVRPCRVAEYSPSPVARSNDVGRHSQQLSPLCSQSANNDDFCSLIQQTRRDLEVRQRQMEDQLEALEHEERTLVEQQLRISSQLGSLPSDIQALASTSHSQPKSSQVDLHPLSSDLPTVIPVSSSSPSAVSLASHESARDQASVSIDSVDVPRLKSFQLDQMASDKSHPQSHEIYFSHSAPFLHSRDIPFHYTSNHLPHVEHLPVSILLTLCISFIYCDLINLLLYFIA